MISFGSIFIFLVGLSIGVMLSSSIFSLLTPSIELSKYKCLTSSIGITLGFIFMMVLDISFE